MSGLMSRPSVLVGGLAVAGISGVCLYLLLRREEEWQSRQGGLSSRSGTVGNSGGSLSYNPIQNNLSFSLMSILIDMFT